MSYTNLKANPHERRKKNTSRQVSTGPGGLSSVKRSSAELKLALILEAARTSRRIASMAARTSYSNLAGDESDPSDSEDEYSSSREGQEDDDEWEGSERSRSRNPKQRRRSSNKHRTWGGGKTKPRVSRAVSLASCSADDILGLPANLLQRPDVTRSG